MGEIVEVVERASSRPGIVRFETNRVLSGTGHERFAAGEPIEGDRPVDELARRLFARGGIGAIHINGGMVTVDLAKGYTSDGLADVIRGLYTFYEPTDAAPGPVDPVEEPKQEPAPGAVVTDAVEGAEGHADTVGAEDPASRGSHNTDVATAEDSTTEREA
jgi:hypothetical protein